MKEMVNAVHRDKGFKRKQIFEIIKKAEDLINTDNQRHFNPKKMVWTDQIIPSVDSSIEAGHQSNKFLPSI
jgi:hypothetical protein